MKVCFLGYRFHHSHFEAINKTAQKIALKLREKGIEVFFISFGPRNETYTRKNIKFYFIGTEGALILAAGVKIRKYIEDATSIIYREKPSVIHDHFTLPIAACLVVGRIVSKLKKLDKDFENIKLVKTVYNHRFKLKDLRGLCTDRLHKLSIRYFFYDVLPQLIFNNYARKFFLKKYDYLICVSKCLEKELQKITPCVSMPLGVEYKTVQTKEEAREILKLPHAKKIVMYLGHFKYSKGVDYLMLALAQVIGKRKDVMCVFAESGFGQGKHFYIKKLEQLGVSKENYRFLGAVTPEVAFTAADIMVMPLITSWGATSIPLSILEALTCGALVITTNVACIASIIKDGYNGFLVMPRCLQALSCTIEKALDLPQRELSRLKDNARASVTEYSWDRLIGLYEEFYEKIT